MLKKIIATMALSLLSFAPGCNPNAMRLESTSPILPTYSASVPVDTTKEDMFVHFIDVGQGDSIFIELPNKETMLIDAGENGDDVVTYIFEQGHNHLDYVIATHDHYDHTGGLDEVLNNFSVDVIYAPVPTNVGTDVLNAMIENNNIPVKQAVTDMIIINEPSLSFKILSAESDAENINNQSIVSKLTYGETTFLFTGDAEEEVEANLDNNVRCDVLKVGHHGSNTSTTSEFLKKVKPEYAIISCGLNNKYGHPSESVYNRLLYNNINVYRTDTQGTIVCNSNGVNISFNKTPVENNIEFDYVVNTKTMKIHYANCEYANSANKMVIYDISEAIDNGYVPCKVCNPAA